MNTTAASADTTDDTTDDTTVPPVPPEVVDYLKYDAKEGETYQGFTLLHIEYIEPSCGVECCGYAQIILRIRTPTGEVVEVG
jgi:hypothetical protein